MATSGFYPGSFDPVTNGHVDIIERASKLFDRLVIGVGAHHGKAPLFTCEERVAMLAAEIARLQDQRPPGAGQAAIEVVTFSGLTVTAALDCGAGAVVRGLRDGTDFDYEILMSGMNATLAPGLETVFLAASPGVRHIASKFVRQIASMGGDVAPFVPAGVAQSLKRKLAGQQA